MEFPIDKEQSYAIYKQLYDEGKMTLFELSNKEGVLAYSVVPDFKGGTVVLELFMYVQPEFRYNPRHFIRLLQELERVGRIYGSVMIASGFAYRDNKMLELLYRRGYVVHTVQKEF